MPQTHTIRTPTVRQYVAAFKALDDRKAISPKQRAMLAHHHAASAHSVSATLLARKAGYKNYRAANSQYGRLGCKIAAEIPVHLPAGYSGVGVIVDFVEPRYAGNEHWLWVLRPNVAKALERLGWVEARTNLLYPPKS